MATHSNMRAWRIPGTGAWWAPRLWGRAESDMTDVTQQQHSSKCQVLTQNYFENTGRSEGGKRRKALTENVLYEKIFTDRKVFGYDVVVLNKKDILGIKKNMKKTGQKSENSFILASFEHFDKNKMEKVALLCHEMSQVQTKEKAFII